MKTIVVTGTHGVGKTALCKRLMEIFENRVDVAFIPEMARILLAKGISMNDKVTEFGIVSYLTEYFRYSRLTEASLVISDRAVFDLFAYISVSRPADVREEFLKLVEEVVHQETRRIDLFVYVPIEFSMHADDVRPPDVAYQRTIDQNVRDLLKFFNARVLPVSGTIEERTETVVRWLDA